MKQLIAIAIGGAIGAVLRFALSGLPARLTPSPFPYGTLLVNVIGCLLIGSLFAFGEKQPLSDPVRGLLITGLLGALTTFSTYALDAFKLMRNGDSWTAFTYLLVSNAVGLLCVFVGYAIVNRLA